MTITYLHHSAFLVETPSACLLFDWFEGELPPIPAEKPLYVLASHSHYDHFSPNIFPLTKDHPKVTYLLSWDIPVENPKSNVHFLQPHETWQDGILSLVTYRSTDEGIAFWCSIDGKEIYHAGDLNHWYWEGEEEQWNRDMTAAYRAEVALMAGKTADVAFIPADPRLEDWFYLGVDDFLRQAVAKHIFPMHFWGDFSVCKKLAEHPCSEKYRSRIQTIVEKGQTFSL